jgi:hypothetical protein
MRVENVRGIETGDKIALLYNDKIRVGTVERNETIRRKYVTLAHDDGNFKSYSWDRVDGLLTE